MPNARDGRPAFQWWRGQDLNLRPSGYEPDELPDCSTPRCARDPSSGRAVPPGDASSGGRRARGQVGGVPSGGAAPPLSPRTRGRSARGSASWSRRAPVSRSMSDEVARSPARSSRRRRRRRGRAAGISRPSWPVRHRSWPGPSGQHPWRRRWPPPSAPCLVEKSHGRPPIAGPVRNASQCPSSRPRPLARCS